MVFNNIFKRIMVSLGFIACAIILKEWSMYFFLLVVLLLGYDVFIDALKNISRGDFLDENFLMLIAVIGSVLSGQFKEGAMVMLLFRIGEYFEDTAVNKSRKSITELMEIMPEYAWLKGEDGNFEKVDPEDVSINDIIIVKPGEKVPLDGVVIKGESCLDTKAITGESIPREVTKGDEIVSGCVNESALLEVRVTSLHEDSTVSKILEMVEEASEKKAKAENFITSFAKWYTPLVVAGALVVAFLPPILGYGPLIKWVKRALVFLVVSCPCALVISVPLTFFGGIGAASKRGILIKGSNYIETLSKLDTVVFDKTGTLTEGVFKVTEVLPEDGILESVVLEKAASLEALSNHPLSKAILEKVPNPEKLDEIIEIPGRGLKSGSLLIGNKELLIEENISFKEIDDESGVRLYLAEDGKSLGSLLLKDEFKKGADSVSKLLKKEGVKKIVILSGDKEKAAKKAGEIVGATLSYGNLLPNDKREKVEGLIKEGSLAFVGDGINDAPVLTRADVGIAMGKLGSAAAIEAADVVLMDDDPLKIPELIKLSRKTIRIVKENIAFALGVKFLILFLATIGKAGMGLAIFGDVGVAMIAILNAMRMLAEKNNK